MYSNKNLEVTGQKRIKWSLVVDIAMNHLLKTEEFMNACNTTLTASNDTEAIKLFQILTGKLGAHLKMRVRSTYA